MHGQPSLYHLELMSARFVGLKYPGNPPGSGGLGRLTLGATVDISTLGESRRMNLIIAALGESRHI